MIPRHRAPSYPGSILIRLALIFVFVFSIQFYPNPKSKNNLVSAASCSTGSAIRTGFVLSNTLPAVDDGSSPQTPLGFSINFFGTNYSSVYVNNNGTVTFTGPKSSFTPVGMTGVNFPVLAPFFADVDTRGTGSGQVQYGQVANIKGHRAFVVNWPSVGYYSNGVNKLNTFQLVIIEREDLLPAGQWDFEFNYGQVQWETGTASGGVNGLGGTSAAVGYSNGITANPIYYEMTGSLMPGAFHSNASSGLTHNARGATTCGRYFFAVRGANGIPTISPRPEITVTSDLPDPSEAGSPYTVIVQVQGEVGAPIPSGKVMVFDGYGKSCTINLVSGMGKCNLASVRLGSMNLTVAYGGDGNYATTNTKVPHQVTASHGPLVLAGPNTDPAHGSASKYSINKLKVAFDKDVIHDGTEDAANNASNYILVEANGDGFQTSQCGANVDAGDTVIPVSGITYSNNNERGPFVATVSFPWLAAGSYRLIVCGTTSIHDMLNVALNDGAVDTIIEFSVTGGMPPRLPKTGFAPGSISKLDPQPVEKQYLSLDDLVLTIPGLNVETTIIGVPVSKDGWDVSWLGEQAGWLTGSAYPTWVGNSVITGHVWNASNQEGPLARLKDLSYGDQIEIHAWGQEFIYEVRENTLITENNLAAAMKHEEDHSWITLLTCENYSAEKDQYNSRRMVRAVLIETK